MLLDKVNDSQYKSLCRCSLVIFQSKNATSNYYSPDICPRLYCLLVYILNGLDVQKYFDLNYTNILMLHLNFDYLCMILPSKSLNH